MELKRDKFFKGLKVNINLFTGAKNIFNHILYYVCVKLVLRKYLTLNPFFC